VGKLIRFRKQEIDSWMEHNRGMACGQGVKSGSHRVRRTWKGNADIDRLIRKAIDQSKGEVYNLEHGKSDRSKGPKKEMNNGSI
jgi:hypothetical protein